MVQVIAGYQKLVEGPEASVVAIGNFDGVHRGHQAILGRLKERAALLGALSVVYTFRPHPVKVLAPSLAPPLISTYEQKMALLEEAGVDLVIEQPFDYEFAAYSPERFVAEILHQYLQTQEVFVGVDFTFGRGGKATPSVLARLGEPFDLRVNVVEPQAFENIVASSTKIREFLLEGRVRGAGLLLGRPFCLSGPIVHGQARGRQLGFPTANIQAEQEILPAYGVYACRVQLDSGLYPAVVNIGVRPTFHEEGPSVEAHLLDFSEDIYEERARIFFIERVRAEKKFDGIEALINQIRKDIVHARQLLARHPVPTSPSPWKM